MKYTFKHKLTILPEILVVPIPKGAHLSETLGTIAKSVQLNEAILKEEFEANQNEVLPLYKDQSRIFLLGLGEKPGFSEMLKAFRSFSGKFKTRLHQNLSLDLLAAHATVDTNTLLEAAVNGLILGTYQIGQFKSEADQSHPLENDNAELCVYLEPKYLPDARKAFERGQAIAKTQIQMFRLVNAPSNKKNPADLAAWAIDSGKKYGYRVEVFDKARIASTGLDALLAVNRGSEMDPAFIIMEYQPENRPAGIKKVGLVGKGVTFDTGGLSIKPSTNMHYMKSDMGGAAAVFGTLEVAAKLQLPIHLIGIVPATDNSVDAKSIKPSDVINSYSKKTIEIIDTDAEGRLILADGLNYMVRNFAPEVLIDLATLTGSTVRTFGYHAGGLFSNSDELARQLLVAGEYTGEKLWRLPLWDVYKEDIKSDVADVRNFSGKPIAGAIGAAKFLEAFIEDQKNWAHLDIAGVAFNDSEFTIQKSATAFGIRLLTKYLEKLY